MNRLSRILVVSQVFPRPRMQESGRFMANLAEGWSAQGLDVEVVTSATLSQRLKSLRRKRVDVDIPGVRVRIVPTLGTPFPRRLPNWLRRWLERRDAKKVVSATLQAARPDMIYAKFATGGIPARRAAQAFGVPYVVDLGESSSLLSGGKDVVCERKRVLHDAAGVICVSPRLRDEAIALGAVPSSVVLIPNYPNWDRFYPRNKAACRRKLNVDPNVFLVAYLGHFIERKGARRLNEALHQMKHAAKAAFFGTGPLEPDFPGTIHSGSVPHDMLPIWLNAADVLALPTIAEGSCNAITEALACALPIVTSDIVDVRWQVPEKGVILINPAKTEEISTTLDMLVENPNRVAAMRQDLEALIQDVPKKSRSLEIQSWFEALYRQFSRTLNE